MRSLRVVLVMPDAPLPFGNAAARWFYVLLKGLVERGHRVAAFAGSNRPEEPARARTLFPSPAFDLRVYPHQGGRRSLWQKWHTLRRPYSYLFSPDLQRDLNATLALGFDVLHLEQLWSGWLGLRWRERALVNIHNLYSIDLEETWLTTWRQRWDRALMLSTERRLVRQFKYIRSSSPRLVPELLTINPDARITTLTLGLDSGLYDFIPDSRRTPEPVVGMIGSMGWYPSRSAAVRLLTRLWPEIKRRQPAARLQIVGWQARERLREFLDWPDVTIAENVPEIRPWFESTGVLLYAPARGSGMKVKVQEALAFGVPVVTTSEGAEGLPVLDGVHAGVCDEDAGLIERTVALLGDRVAQEKQRVAGRKLLEHACGPGPTLDAMERIYEQMTCGG